ncbi:MAG: Nif3-like dinuclear metal center hexameric protein [Spirochaetia bacterium]|jgi:dinuclear metal center YbgI/SA1388 family protein|nr:Nif3-like dinuclear metal center hexameric protein [Spirochaetia bacterium]
MTLSDFDLWCRSFLRIDELRSIDDSLNGIQVGRSGGQLTKVAFAVDACAASIRRAAEAKAELLFVHHGMFWGSPARIEGPLLERIRGLLKADMGLYACHLPLDMHPELGNNAQLANLLQLADRKPFGIYHGVAIGVSGRLPQPRSAAELSAAILPDNSRPRTVIAAGPEPISTVAIVSGGAPFEALQALGVGIDAFITGEPSHSVYHQVVEGGLTFIAAGHYATETWGLKAVEAKLKAETGLQTLFIDLPTGL